MSFLATGKVDYRARIGRAEVLAARHHSSRQILEFYGQVARFQRDLYEDLQKSRGKQGAITAGSLRTELSVPVLLDPFSKFLSVIESHAPGPLAARSREIKVLGEMEWGKILKVFWRSRLLEPTAEEPHKEFLVRAFLQPLAEYLATAQLPPISPMTSCRCPRCNSLPLLGVLRPEGDGGKRYLQCSFCLQEWEFRRILCANCGEEQEQQLAVYVAEQFPHVRVECCETCKHFLRTIDLTKDGNAVPLVDDLAAIPLSLWASENGYTRIQGNLLGT